VPAGGVEPHGSSHGLDGGLLAQRKHELLAQVEDSALGRLALLVAALEHRVGVGEVAEPGGAVVGDGQRRVSPLRAGQRHVHPCHVLVEGVLYRLVHGESGAPPPQLLAQPVKVNLDPRVSFHAPAPPSS